MSAKQKKLLWIFLFVGQLIGKVSQPTIVLFRNFCQLVDEKVSQLMKNGKFRWSVGWSVSWLVSWLVGRSVRRSVGWQGWLTKHFYLKSFVVWSVWNFCQLVDEKVSQLMKNGKFRWLVGWSVGWLVGWSVSWSVSRWKGQPTRNKAIYTTASVAYRWAGALMRFRKLFARISTAWRTNRQTGGRTDSVTYRVMCTRLKSFLEMFYKLVHT